VIATQHSALASPSLPAHENLQITACNVLDAASLRGVFLGATQVMHLAGKISIMGDPDGSVWATNVEGTRNVVTAALECGVKRVVHCSSVHAFNFASAGDEPLSEACDLLSEDADIAIYDRSKAAGQREVLAAVEQGLDAVIVQPTGVIGPHDYAPSRMGQVFLDLKSGTMPGLTHGGFDFVDVRDVATAMMAAMHRGRSGENYLLGGHYVTIPELARLCQEITGSRAPRLVSPLWLAGATAPVFEAWAKLTKATPLYTRESIETLSRGRPTNCKKAQEELGYTRRPLQISIQDIYADFAQRDSSPHTKPTDDRS
jgi:dihydroflavonol-4-reductase